VSETNLTGLWRGQYAYPRGYAPVFFTAELVETAGALTGATSEPDQIFGGTASASIRGDRRGTLVTFLKIYDRPSFRRRVRNEVAYEGTLSADATEIEGRWTISRMWSGKFLMIRSTGIEESVTKKAFERV
jgi:hypothetical protein